MTDHETADGLARRVEEFLLSGLADMQVAARTASVIRPAIEERDRLRTESERALALLRPASPEETLEGAIRNLQQAHLSEKGNAETLRQKLQAAEERIEAPGFRRARVVEGPDMGAAARIWMERALEAEARVGKLETMLEQRTRWMHDHDIREPFHDRHAFYESCNSLWCIHARALLSTPLSPPTAPSGEEQPYCESPFCSVSPNRHRRQPGCPGLAAPPPVEVAGEPKCHRCGATRVRHGEDGECPTPEPTVDQGRAPVPSGSIPLTDAGIAAARAQIYKRKHRECDRPVCEHDVQDAREAYAPPVPPVAPAEPWIYVAQDAPSVEPPASAHDPEPSGEKA